MTRRLFAATPLATSVLWAVALMIDGGPWDQGGAFLIGIGLIIPAVVAVVGTIVSHSRWARRLEYGVLIAGLGVALARPIDTIWVITVVMTLVGLVALSLPTSAEMTRRLESATGPPGMAVVVSLLLLCVPFTLGFASWTGTTWATLVVGISAPVTALWYSRVLPGGLYLCRYGWPALAVVMAPLQPMPAAIASATLGVLAGVVAQAGSVKVAFYPPRERGTAYPIPPELAPKEVLDAADLDERGRRR